MRLSELCVAVIDCEHKTAPIQSWGVPSIRTTDIKNGRLDIRGANRVSEETYLEWTARLEPKPGDLILAREAPVGEVGIVPQGQRVCLGQRTVLIRADETKVQSRYLLYLLLTPEMRHKMVSRGEGSVVPHLNMSDIRNLDIPLIHSIPEQRAIAHILGTLDDKIELNRRMNETLEAVARAIFKSWFVDFDPVRAKMEGRRPVGMDEETAALFPEEMEESEVGKIPRGWKIERLGDVIELAYGRALKEDNRNPGSIPVYGSNGQVGWHNEKLADGPGIIIGRKGNPGTVVWSPTDFFCIDTTFYVVPNEICQSMYYLFHALQTQDLATLGADSAVPGLNRNIAYMNSMLVPAPEVLTLFDDQVAPLGTLVYLNSAQSRTLAAIRDALLPKLISGELPVE